MSTPAPAPRPLPPILPGWHVTYRGPDGRLRGGYPDPAGRVMEAWYAYGQAWWVTLADGTTIRLSAVVSVGRTDADGRLISAWTVREHGDDGEGSKKAEG